MSISTFKAGKYEVNKKQNKTSSSFCSRSYDTKIKQALFKNLKNPDKNIPQATLKSE